MSADLGYLNLKTPIIEKDGTPTRAFWGWLNQTILARLQTAPYAVPDGIVALDATTGGTAAIGATSLVAATSGPRYRVSYTFRVSQAGSVSSSLQVVIRYTKGGVLCSQSVAAYTGNVTNAPQSAHFLLHVDAGTVITYETVFASVGAPAMQYELTVLAEATA